jgi:hypothetical protein
MIGYAYGRIAQNLCPANQLTGDELAIAEDGVSVQIDHIPPAEIRLSIKHYPQKIFVAISVGGCRLVLAEKRQKTSSTGMFSRRSCSEAKTLSEYEA